MPSGATCHAWANATETTARSSERKSIGLSMMFSRVRTALKSPHSGLKRYFQTMAVAYRETAHGRMTTVIRTGRPRNFSFSSSAPPTAITRAMTAVTIV